jgi:hypothetical protein
VLSGMSEELGVLTKGIVVARELHRVVSKQGDKNWAG